MGDVTQRTWTPEGWKTTSASNASATREELNAQAESLGLDPSDYRTKDDVAAAIAEAEAGAGE